VWSSIYPGSKKLAAQILRPPRHLAVVGTVDSRLQAKFTEISTELTGHPFRQGTENRGLFAALDIRTPYISAPSGFLTSETAFQSCRCVRGEFRLALLALAACTAFRPGSLRFPWHCRFRPRALVVGRRTTGSGRHVPGHNHHGFHPRNGLCTAGSDSWRNLAPCSANPTRGVNVTPCRPEAPDLWRLRGVRPRRGEWF
jgi:hypothetical protein